jgi:DNA-binding protein HU-beta
MKFTSSLALPLFSACCLTSAASAFLLPAALRTDVTTLFAAVEKADTFRKTDFIAAVAEKTGMNKKESEKALKTVLEIVQEQVNAGKRVNLAGFGTFTVKERAARKGRNPQTGEELQIAASKSPGFTPAKAWKDSINGRLPELGVSKKVGVIKKSPLGPL